MKSGLGPNPPPIVDLIHQNVCCFFVFLKLPLGKFKKNICMDLVHNGGGVSGQVHFSHFFITFNVKIMSKNWKRMIKQW